MSLFSFELKIIYTSFVLISVAFEIEKQLTREDKLLLKDRSLIKYIIAAC